MHPVIAALARGAAARPEQPALADGTRTMSRKALHDAVTEAAVVLRHASATTIALALDNSPAWVVLDLATLAARLRCVPVPGFFSVGQLRHLLNDAGPDLLITDQPERYAELLRRSSALVCAPADLVVAGVPLLGFRLRPASRPVLPAGTVKITYTSGTTGTPKGVCLGAAAVARVAASLAQACPLMPTDRHLSLLPMSALLENVGVYATLLAGGACIAPPLAAVGMSGAARHDAASTLTQLERSHATTAIATPEMLHGLLDLLEAGAVRPAALRFLAVGGAPLHASAIERAGRLGLPAFQGYGLSECTSVVALNTPGATRSTSAGRALPHASIAIAEDGEILVSGATLLGYCGLECEIPDPWPSGDLGRLEDGYLYITGRKKNLFITSFGRNVSPEWVESELTAQPAIRQAWVWGEARPWNVAVITPAEHHGRPEVDAAVRRVNAVLPDYARVRSWIHSDRAFSFDDGELTANGRLRRDTLLARYRGRIEPLYFDPIHRQAPQHVL